MGDLDGVPVAAQQPRPEQLLDQPQVFLVPRDRTPRNPGTHRVATLVRRHQPQHQLAEHRLVLRVQTAEHPFGGLGNRLANATCRGIPLHRERAPLTVAPRLAQHVGKQGQGSGFASHLAHQQVDQARLEPQSCLRRRSLDGQPQIGLGHRPQEVEAALDEACELGMGRQLAQPVGPHREDQRMTLGEVDQGREELAPLRRALCGGKGFLALVHDEHRAGTAGHAAQGRHRVGARRDHVGPQPVAFQRCGHARPRE